MEPGQIPSPESPQELEQAAGPASGFLNRTAEAVRAELQIGVGISGPEKGKWPGHLVAELGGRVLIDLTLDQANRPEHDIILPVPFVAPIDADFFSPEKAARRLVNGCLVIYKARPEDRSFEGAAVRLPSSPRLACPGCR